jgi:ABC-2 type transport system ATP-binding protein
MNAVITAKQLNKHYKKFQALKNIDLDIKQGQIVGLLGPNGAGKTTLLKAIFGLTSFDGELKVAGLDPRKQRMALMQRMCFIADVAILPNWLKVKNAVDFIEGIHPKFDREKALGFLKNTDINLESKVKQLSKGMVAQLHLALVMAIDAEILVLDEPTLGLDILYRKTFYQRILNDYYHEKRTIIITTHQVEEVESILTDLIIINKGELVLEKSMEDINQHFTQVVANTAENAEKLKALNPLSYNNEFGKVKFIFENAAIEQLKALGEISTAAVSDIFVAKVTQQNNTKGAQA